MKNKKLNNKGYMLIEIIVASAIALVMAYFLINITIKLVNKNNDYYLDSILLANKTIITKEIMDDINSKKLVEVTIENSDKAKLIYDDGTEKELVLEKSLISYGDYDKELSDNLNIGSLNITASNDILTISIPAYTDYSKKDYGINIAVPYNDDIKINYPVIIPEEIPTEKIDNSGANPPLLKGALIPVVYDKTCNEENRECWVKADIYNSSTEYGWYDYNAQKWANAVLVTETNRSKYILASDGYEVKSEDILAHYVWIPRYKYKLFNVNKTEGTDSYGALESGVDIVFEDGISSTGTVTCTISNKGKETCTNASNGKYYTHPAFTFGDDELTGFWIGKFEVTGSVSQPTILPLSEPINSIYKNMLTYYNIGKKFTESNNVYGLTGENVDSHIIKTREWGAVSFLTNSKYGRCKDGTCEEVTTNNSYCQVTGNAGDSLYSSSTFSESKIIITNAYNTDKGGLASTTGNIYGVFDMSGGCWEYTMGNMVYTSGSVTDVISGMDEIANSGFNGFLISYNEDTNAAIVSKKTDGIDLDPKYYDRYEYSDDPWDAYRSHLGDASAETWTDDWNGRYWYNDYALFPFSSSTYGGTLPWVARSGNGAHLERAGVFFTQGNTGGIVSARDEAGNDRINTTRYILTIIKSES